MYKVVEFVEGDVSIVRNEWLTPKKNSCFWPLFKSSIKFNKYLQREGTPDVEKWTKCTVKRLFYETNDLIKAREKCRRAESESELCTDTEVVGIGTRRKRKRKIIDSDTTDDETPYDPPIAFPKPPATDTVTDIQEERQIISSPKPSTSTSCQHSESPITRPISRGRAALLDFSVDSPAPASPTSVDTAILYRNNSVVATSDQSQILNNINNSLSQIASHLSDIKFALKDIKDSQFDVLSRLTFSAAPGHIPEDITLPLKTEEEINNIEEWLKEENNRQNLINYLSCIGGHKTGHIVRRILVRSFDNTLAIKLNWTGKNNKRSLKNLKLTQVIIDAVRKNKIAENETDQAIIDVLLSWFRFAKDRDGGRDERRKSRTTP